MNVLVIGGSGFLSGHVTRVAREAGHAVTIVTRGQRPSPEGVTAIVADRKDASGFARAVEESGQKWDLAIDCIGFSAADAEQDASVIAPRCGHLVFVSTDFVYSTVDRPFPVDETFSEFETELGYGKGKREAELIVLSAASQVPVTIVRPCHIYGPGSQLGCLPNHGRDPKLIDRLRAGETLALVGGGYFLQQPVYAPDLAKMMLSVPGNDRAYGQIFHAAGPDVIESRAYYQIVARHLGVRAAFDEVRVTDFLRDHPDRRSFCCHRVYSMQKAKDAGLATPSTPIVEGLKAHVESMARSG